jgi:hypothetical protein
MISLQKQYIALAPALYQQVDDLPRAWSPVDVVAEEDLDRAGDWARFEIVIDAHEKFRQEIGAPVYVSDGINAPTSGDAWPRFRLL